MKKSRKTSIFFSIIVFLIQICAISVKAEVNSLNDQTYNRILFVIDCSNSMNSNDEDRLTNEIIKMFVEGSNSLKTEIGFVTYNDEILSSYPIRPIKETKERNEINTEIDKIERYGSTDIGMAINFGMDMFLKNPVVNSRSVMVLISDGETDLTYTKTGRTYRDSQEDENAAFEKSKQLNCPIYAIGLSKDGAFNTNYLKKIAENTGAKDYKIQRTSELLGLFNTLFTDFSGTPVVSDGIIKGTGEEQSVTVPIPNRYISEANILIQHNKPLNITKVSSDATRYESPRFVGLKILSPASGSVIISFTASKDDDVRINIISFVNVLPKIEPPISLSAKEIPIHARLYAINSNEGVTDSGFYNNLTAQLIITNRETGEIKTIPMDNTGTGFSAAYRNENPNTYDLQVDFTGADYNEKSNVENITFTNTAPEFLLPGRITVLKQNKEKYFNLNDYFTDSDGDTLSYEIIDHDKNISTAEINANILSHTSIKDGVDIIKISVSDGRGATVIGVLEFNIEPFWIYYRNPVLGVGCIFIVLLAAYLIFERKSKKIQIEEPDPPEKSNVHFSGARFEGYFLNVASGKDIPVLNWNSTYIENKQCITLGDLFSILDVTEKLPEAHKIYFEAGNNGTVIFYHTTNCVVSLGKRDIPHGKKEVLNYDDRLYIVFEDSVTEIEIRYKRARKMAMA